MCGCSCGRGTVGVMVHTVCMVAYLNGTVAWAAIGYHTSAVTFLETKRAHYVKITLLSLTGIKYPPYFHHHH